MLLTRPHMTAASLAILVLIGFAGSAAAEPGDVAGTYTVTFANVANNCHEDALKLERSRLTLETRGDDRLVARIPGVAAMTGTERQGGQFRADVRSGATEIEGTRARYSVAGRVRGGDIQLVFIAEYYRGDRPLCTQSWSGSGSAGASSTLPAQ